MHANIEGDFSERARRRAMEIANDADIRIDHLVKSGKVTDKAKHARVGHVGRVRLTRIMDLYLLAPDIQEEILHPNDQSMTLPFVIPPTTSHCNGQRYRSDELIPSTVFRIIWFGEDSGWRTILLASTQSIINQDPVLRLR